MNLQTELIKEFAEVVHDVSGNKQRLSDNIVYGTLSKEGAHNYVKIDGSDLLTPVVVSASADSGDRVGVIIKNHTAIAGFNFSSPSVNTRTMENLVSTVNGKFDRIDATYITAEKANLTFATIQSLEAVDGKFDNLDTKFLTVESAKLQYATVEKLNATDAKVGSISGDFANFKNGEFEDLKAKKADIDLANVANAWIQNGIIKDGSIGAAAIHDGAITNVKIADATIEAAKIKSINADTITTGTLKTKRLIITGEDGRDSIVKAINMANGIPEAEVNDRKIQAASIDVVDLSAFHAKIALFEMSANAIYSEKTSIKDPTSGIYISTTGIGIGNGGLTGKNESPIQMYADGSFKLVGKNSKLDFNTVTGEMDIEASGFKVASKAVATKDDIDDVKSEVTTRVTEAESKITQNANNINLRVEKNGVISAINQSSETVAIDASKINLNGYVTISSLSGSGTTTIDGSNIKTGKISMDRLDVNGIFAKDVTATGTITGATLVGSSITTKSGNKGSVDIARDTISAKYSYASGKTQEMYIYADGLSFGETVKNGNSASTYSYVSLDQNGLYIQDIVHLSRSAAQATFSCNVVAPGLGVNGSADINKDLRVYGSMRANGNITTSTIELYAATPFVDFHFDGNNGDYTSRIIELEPGKLNVNGVVCNSGAIWGTNIAIDGPGTFTKGITSKAESVFHTGSYTDPYPGKVCTIKSWGTVASLRFAAKGVSNTWLGAAKPDGAAYDTICTDANALVPGWRVRTADGAWVGASYAQDPGFRIYYCNASRLGGSNNGTDAIYTFGASGTFHAKSVSQTSDEREKNIISGITEKYENLFMRLKPVLFNWKTGTDGIHMGFGAQTTLDLAEKCGISANELAAVHRSETEEPWSMSYTEIVPLTVQMTQKVTKKTVEQDQKIKILESHIQMLQTALDQAFVEIAKLKKAVG